MRSEILLTAFVAALWASSAVAMGKPAPAPNSCGGDASLTTPSPARAVVLGHVTTMPFNIPNGQTVQLDLDSIFSTAVSGTNVYRPSDVGVATDPCGEYLLVTGAVTTLELNATQIGITVGYSPTGGSSAVTGVTGSVGVSIGTIAMDFAVRQCSMSGCETVGAVSDSAAQVGLSASFTIDFGPLTTGPSLVTGTPLGDVLRGIMNDGLKKLVAATNPSVLSWSASVLDVTPGAGMFTFDAGTQSLIQPNQTFAVYSVTPANGACTVLKAVANAHTTQVEPLTSTALIDNALDPEGVKAGDRVVIRQAGGK